MRFKVNRVLIVVSLSTNVVLFFVSLMLFASQSNRTINNNIVNQNQTENVDWNQPFNPDSLTGKQILEYFHWSNASSCRLVNYFGGSVNLIALDGQKAVCFDPELKPMWPCLVYSFGINKEWSFEDQMAKYGCNIYAFDPSTNETNHDRGKMIHFQHIGLSNIEESTIDGWNLYPLSNIYKSLSISAHPELTIIDYLKIDIESYEWKVIPQILESGMLNHIRQLSIEVHLTINTNTTLSDLRSLVKILKSLEDYGMVRFDSKLNPVTERTIYPMIDTDDYSCYEIAWYNHRLRKPNHLYFP